MRALGLGKVSHDKQRQAMTPLPLIAMVAVVAVLIKRRQSTRDKNTLNVTRNKAMATNSIWKSQGGLADRGSINQLNTYGRS
jgi:hypothetical protein